MSNRIENILEEYNFYDDLEVKVISRENINDSISKCVPEAWTNALCEDNTEKKIDKILEMWNVLAEELSLTIDYMKDNLQDVDLIQIGDKFYLLYSIMSSDEEIIYYVGGNPRDSQLEAKNWPETLAVFYEKLHNGFYDYCSKAMGLVESQNISCIAEDEWGILEELEEPLQINLSTTYSFFESGTGGYVVIDQSTDKPAVWFADEQPEYDVVFWDVVDTWILMGLDEEF